MNGRCEDCGHAVRAYAATIPSVNDNVRSHLIELSEARKAEGQALKSGRTINELSGVEYHRYYRIKAESETLEQAARIILKIQEEAEYGAAL